MLIFFYPDFNELSFPFAGDMAPLSELASKKPKSRSKRVNREEKRKTLVEHKSLLPEHEFSLPEHDIPKEPEVPKQLEALKLKGVVFKEPAPQTKTLPTPVEGKGKGVLVEFSCPTKR